MKLQNTRNRSECLISGPDKNANFNPAKNCSIEFDIPKQTNQEHPKSGEPKVKTADNEANTGTEKPVSFSGDLISGGPGSLLNKIFGTNTEVVPTSTKGPEIPSSTFTDEPSSSSTVIVSTDTTPQTQHKTGGSHHHHGNEISGPPKISESVPSQQNPGATEQHSNDHKSSDNRHHQSKPASSNHEHHDDTAASSPPPPPQTINSSIGGDSVASKIATGDSGDTIGSGSKPSSGGGTASNSRTLESHHQHTDNVKTGSDNKPSGVGSEQQPSSSETTTSTVSSSGTASSPPTTTTTPISSSSPSSVSPTTTGAEGESYVVAAVISTETTPASSSSMPDSEKWPSKPSGSNAIVDHSQSGEDHHHNHSHNQPSIAGEKSKHKPETIASGANQDGKSGDAISHPKISDEMMPIRRCEVELFMDRHQYLALKNSLRGFAVDNEFCVIGQNREQNIPKAIVIRQVFLRRII